ncbi:SGT1-domain-containing protein [Zopfia rhizophila CBS 207.26]|uniref:SGT1-domain-containing protein n=1 Tax=Zopfia rhizophila CBS 207.26 TaxID=1314779 RepID=A0A6A6DD17_9PEZI|nr:SGT1-domain-containing protein [Zopfia rhizophila CBS 207.26]
MEAVPQDDFKWFDEGFDGFPKRLPEDVVEYIVFIIDSKLSDVQTRERLQAFQRAMTELEKKFLKEYIWQRESINLELFREEGTWLLRGSTSYGDSVADEWLIVYFLRKLSKQFPDAWMHIYDTDGEFLLIEAANALPKWLNPEVAENRVWINSHKLLVIPLEKGANPKPLSTKEALTIIRSSPGQLQHLPKLEEEAFHRLKGYPKAISDNQHHATIPLPRKVAAILQTNPSYIAPVVEAFYLRDPVSLRLIQPDKSRQLLKFPPVDWVNVSTRFTKVLYAQLRSQEWTPPSPWCEALLSQSSKNSISREKAEIGVKLAAGFEMLVQHKLYENKRAVREIHMLLEDIENGDEPLPTDAEISQWPEREDDESWLDIDFSAFEAELAGGGRTGPDIEGLDGGGFGDKSAQENLRKMVQRFEEFLRDEDAGLDGAEIDDMDVDNDDDEAGQRGWEDPESGNEDGDVEFDENEFKNIMSEIMGISAAEKSVLLDEARELASEEEQGQEEDEEIKKLSELMEEELLSHGALKLDPEPGTATATKHAIGGVGKGKGKQKIEEIEEEEDEDDDGEEEIDIDFNLAKNMLESLKGQSGMAGPAGNLMGLMGVRFPRDEEDEEEEKPGKS